MIVTVSVHPLWIILSVFGDILLFQASIAVSLLTVLKWAPNQEEVQIALLMVSLVLGFRLIYRILRFMSIRYRIQDRAIVIRSGIFLPRAESIDLTATSVVASQNLLQRAVNGGDLSLNLAGGQTRRLKNLAAFSRVRSTLRM